MPGIGPDLGILQFSTSIPQADALRANGTVNGTSVDGKNAGGYAAGWVVSALGTGTTPNLAVTIQDSANDSSFAAVSTGTGAIQPTAFTAITTTASTQYQRFNAQRARRYWRMSGVITGGAGGGFTYCAGFIYEQRPTVG